MKVTKSFTTDKWGGFEIGDGEFFIDNLFTTESGAEFYIYTKMIEKGVYKTIYVPTEEFIKDCEEYKLGSSPDFDFIEMSTYVSVNIVSIDEILAKLKENNKVSIWEINLDKDLNISDFMWYYLGFSGFGKEYRTPLNESEYYKEIQTLLKKDLVVSN